MAWVLNFLLPGSGLILRNREWLGLSLAAVFAICADVAIAGAVIAPAAIPSWLTILAAVLAGICWVLSQILFRRQSQAALHHQAGIEELGA